MAIGAYPKGGGIFNIVINGIFAITKISVAISGMAKSRNRKEPVLFALKNINTVIAFISLFNLQIAIIIPFAHGYTMWEVVAALGALIAGGTLILGVYMIILSSVKLKKIRVGEAHKTIYALPAPLRADKESETSAPNN